MNMFQTKTSEWDVTIKTSDDDTGVPLYLDAIVTLEYDGSPCEVTSYVTHTVEYGEVWKNYELSEIDEEELFEAAQAEFHKFMEDTP